MADKTREILDYSSGEYSLAMSYYQIYHGCGVAGQGVQETSDDTKPRSKDSMLSASSKQPKQPEDTTESNDELLWEEYEWTDDLEKELQMTLERSLEKCRISLTNGGGASYNPPKDDDAWNDFYTSHQTNFFKDKHYLHTAFPKQFEPSSRQRVWVEVGCGVGNAFLPLLQEETTTKGGEKAWAVHGIDLSSVAIDLLKQDERFVAAALEGQRAQVHVANVVQGIPAVCREVAHVTSLLFCLSAMDPEQDQIRAACNVAATLQPGGFLVVRDYGRLDESQLKLGSQRNKLLKDNFYLKHDTTKCYFFTLEELEHLFVTHAGLEVVELKYIRRIYKNRSTHLSRRRVWVHGCFQKPWKRYCHYFHFDVSISGL